MRYAFIERHRGTWPIVAECRVLQVSASGYHQHRLRQAAERGGSVCLNRDRQRISGLSAGCLLEMPMMGAKLMLPS